MSVEKKDVSLTEEMKKKIARYMAIVPEAEFKYVPAVYRINDMPKAVWPAFTLRGLDGLEATLNEDRTEFSPGKGAYSLNSGESKLYSCRHGIRGWKNLRDQNGVIVPDAEFNFDGTLSDKSLRLLSPSLISELANAINEQCRLTAEEELGLE